MPHDLSRVTLACPQHPLPLVVLSHLIYSCPPVNGRVQSIPFCSLASSLSFSSLLSSTAPPSDSDRVIDPSVFYAPVIFAVLATAGVLFTSVSLFRPFLNETPFCLHPQPPRYFSPSSAPRATLLPFYSRAFPSSPHCSFTTVLKVKSQRQCNNRSHVFRSL